MIQQQFKIIHKNIPVDVLMTVPTGQEHLVQDEMNRLHEYLNNFFKEHEKQCTDRP